MHYAKYIPIKYNGIAQKVNVRQKRNTEKQRFLITILHNGITDKLINISIFIKK